MKVVIYSDGGADPNPGLGGWAAILRYGEHEKVLTGNDPATTNNRMELQAAIAALSALNRPSDIEFYTDSEYLRRGITEWIERWAARGWQRSGRKPVPNADLWQALWSQVRRHHIDWRWVKGHAGNPLNERVDRLARQARLAITPEEEALVDRLSIYVRASCQGNPGPGGWGVVLEDDGETRQESGGEPGTTNNRMELMGAVAGLRLVPAGGAIQLFTLSDYVFQGATRWIHGWRRRQWRKKDGRPVSHADLWQELDQLAAQRRIRWLSLKGETDLPPGMIEAARLATAAAASFAA